MPEPLLYLKAMSAAAAVSALIMLAARGLRPPAERSRACWLNAAGAVAVGGGFAAGAALLGLRWSWPPASGLDRFLTIVLPTACAIELLAAQPRMRRGLAWLLRFSLAASAGRILLHGSVYLSGPNAEWTAWQTAMVLAVSGLLLGAVWALLSRLVERTPGLSVPLSVALATQTAGLCVMLAGYLQGGAAAIPLTAALFGAAVTSYGSRQSPNQPAAPWQALLGLGVVSLFAVLFVGRFFGAISTSTAIVVLLAPLLCWGAELPKLRRQNAWLGLAMTAIVLLVVLMFAKCDFDRRMRPLLVHALQRSQECTNSARNWLAR